MSDADEKAKAEKLAAAKKRVEQLKKQKAKKVGGGAAAASKKDDNEPKDGSSRQTEEPPQIGTGGSSQEAAGEEEDTKHSPAADLKTPASPVAATSMTPSLSEQSKARSASFRKASITSGPLSPVLPADVGETAPDIYRKHVARIEELEKENKRLARESAEAEKRWRKAEEELADLREADGEGSGAGQGRGVLAGQVEQLKSELAAVQRQNAQLQARRHGSSPSMSLGVPSQELAEQLASRTATIESMELEMSRLRAQLERLASPSSTASEQVSALEEKVARAERAAGMAQRELADLKRNLERASEKAVREGSERASAETKVRTLEREAAEAAEQRDAERKRAEALDKKVATLTTLHREQDARSQALRRDKEKAEGALAALRARLGAAEAENLRLRKQEARDGGGTDDDAVDELESEGRSRLEARIRELEADNHELKRGIWHERRKEMQVGPDGEPGGGGVATPFSEVELGSPAATRKPSAVAASGGGFGEFLASGLSALTGGGPYPHSHSHHQHHGHGHGEAAVGDDSGLLEDDDDDEFDEAAFRRAQEEDAKRRLERVREVKRALKNWEGWRLDLVEIRAGSSEGIGEIFEV